MSEKILKADFELTDKTSEVNIHRYLQCSATLLHMFLKYFKNDFIRSNTLVIRGVRNIVTSVLRLDFPKGRKDACVCSMQIAYHIILLLITSSCGFFPP